MQRKNNQGRLIVRDGKLVTAGEEPAIDTAFTSRPPRGPVQTGDFSDDSRERLDSPVERAIYKTLTAYRDYFSERCRAALAKDITAKVKSLGELSNAESITAVVRRSIDWSGHAVPQAEITTITEEVTSTIKGALRNF